MDFYPLSSTAQHTPGFLRLLITRKVLFLFQCSTFERALHRQRGLHTAQLKRMIQQQQPPHPQQNHYPFSHSLPHTTAAPLQTQHQQQQHEQGIRLRPLRAATEPEGGDAHQGPQAEATKCPSHGGGPARGGWKPSIYIYAKIDMMDDANSQETAFGLQEFWTSLDDAEKHALLSLRRVSLGIRGITLPYLPICLCLLPASPSFLPCLGEKERAIYVTVRM